MFPPQLLSVCEITYSIAVYRFLTGCPLGPAQKRDRSLFNRRLPLPYGRGSETWPLPTAPLQSRLRNVAAPYRSLYGRGSETWSRLRNVAAPLRSRLRTVRYQ